MVVKETYLETESPKDELEALEQWDHSITPRRRVSRPFCMALLALDGLLLAAILPFAIVVLAVVVVGMVFWQWMDSRRLEWKLPAALLVPGGLYLVYQYWAIISDPVLAGWNAQNITTAPAVWDFLLSLSPVLPLAVAGAVLLFRRMRRIEGLPNLYLKASLVWLVTGVVLIYLPFPLQRRFLLGYYIPLAALAVYLLDWARARLAGNPRWPVRAVFGLALPTNLVLIALVMFGIMSRAPELYLTKAEANLFNWMRLETPPGALFLTSPEMGLFIPAHTGQRVLFGHPFETVNAQNEEEQVAAFFQGELEDADIERFLVERGVDYVIVGERERLLGKAPDLTFLPVAFEQDEVRVYLVGILP